MTNEIELIRRLVLKLSEIENSTIYKMHEASTIRWPQPLIYDTDERCPCILCKGRQYLEWREEPKTE